MVKKPTRTNFRTWDQIMENELTSNPFNGYLLTLSQIGATAEDALQRMWELFEEAITNYTFESIQEIFSSNYIANKKKYDQLVEFYADDLHLFGDYFRSEDYDHTRTPNLSSGSTSSGTGSASTKNNQTATTTTTPNAYTNTTSHNVVPFDATTGERLEYKDTSVESGSRATATSYSGQPDTTNTTSSATSTVSTTGTDKNQYTKIISGRDGRRPTSEVVQDGLKAAALLNILDIIINDVADEIFLQVWI